MNKSSIRFKADSYDAEQGVFEGYASVFGVLDSDGDIVQPGAFSRTLAEGEAKDGVRLLLQHDDRALPIGKTLELREDERGLYIKGYISPTSEGMDVRQLVKDGVLVDMSIGYVPVQEDTDSNGVRNLRDVELLEISIVTFPANPQARIQGYKAQTTQTKQGGSKMNFDEMTPEEQEQILEAVREAAIDAVDEAIKAAFKSSEDTEDEEKETEDEEKDDTTDDEEKRKSAKPAAARKKKGSTLERAALASAKSSKSAGRGPIDFASIFLPRPAQTEEKSKVPLGINFVRSIKCMAQAKGDPEHGAQIAQKSYGDATLAREIKALTATSPTGGGYLIPEMYAAEVIPLLTAQAVITRLGATVIPMPTGTLNLPKMTSGTSASYVGEMRPGKASQPTFGNIRLSAKKLISPVIISNDLLRANTYQADQLVLNQALEQMVLAMDLAGFMGEGTEYKPTGLFKMKGISRINLDGMPNESTTGRMLGQLLQKNVDTSKLGWAFNGFAWEAFYNVTNAMGLYIYRQQMDEGKLTMHPYAISNQLVQGKDEHGISQVVLGNWADFLIGMQMDIKADFSTEGTMLDKDGNLVSAFQQDATLLRIISTHDFAVRHEESFVIADIHTK